MLLSLAINIWHTMDAGAENSISTGREIRRLQTRVNVGDTERLASAITGIGFTMVGLAKPNLRGLVLTALGSYLVYRGVTGHCVAYQTGNISTVGPQPEGILVDRSVQIDLPPHEVYRFWRDFENLPHFMDHLEAVWMIGDHRYHWVAEAPAGMSVEWDADVILERPAELIAWRSRPGSQIPNEGSVRFEERVGGLATEVHVSLRYYPPAGRIGAWIAKLFGEEPGQQIEQDLEHLKDILESGK
jgi:uncharacterized membrane protein